MALSAQITIPWQPVPFTLQTLVLMLCSLGLGWKRAVLVQIGYLAVGAAGLPVFSGASYGVGTLFGATSGYLFSFVVVAAWLGWCADRSWTSKALPLGFALLTGICLNLGLGWLVLRFYVGDVVAWKTGVAPFVVIELAKMALVTLALPPIYHAVRKIGQVQP